jgi:hypothetical protein
MAHRPEIICFGLAVVKHHLLDHLPEKERVLYRLQRISGIREKNQRKSGLAVRLLRQNVSEENIHVQKRRPARRMGRQARP